MDFAILSSICIYLMLISVYVLRGFYQCCCAAEPRGQHRLENGLLEMVPVESTALELEDQIHEELPWKYRFLEQKAECSVFLMTIRTLNLTSAEFLFCFKHASRKPLWTFQAIYACFVCPLMICICHKNIRKFAMKIVS